MAARLLGGVLRKSKILSHARRAYSNGEGLPLTFASPNKVWNFPHVMSIIIYIAGFVQ